MLRFGKMKRLFCIMNDLNSFAQVIDQLPCLTGNPDAYPPHLICPLSNYDLIQSLVQIALHLCKVNLLVM